MRLSLFAISYPKLLSVAKTRLSDTDPQWIVEDGGSEVAFSSLHGDCSLHDAPSSCETRSLIHILKK